MRKLILLLASIIPFGITTGQNQLPSIISKDTILSKDHSPYVIEGNLSILSGATLTIKEGVTIKLSSQSTIAVNGNLVASGKEGDSIYFASINKGELWKNIVSTNGNIELDYIKTSGNLMLISASGGEKIVIRHSYITSAATLGNGSDCIAVHSAKKVYIEYISLIGSGGTIDKGSKNDAIDLDEVDSCFIQHNYITSFSDDGIDIGTESKYALINDNYISHCDYGVTVGESSDAYLSNIISAFNYGGFQVHTSATITCDHNTLYSNKVGIECYHSEEGTTKATGGTAIVKNTIVSKSGQDVATLTSSSITVSYSVSDKSSLTGDHNIFSDPLLVDPDNGNFFLKTNSPCLGAGSPDDKGNATNIGAPGEIQNETVVENPSDLQVNWKVSPNPATENLQIIFPAGYQTILVTVYDNTGKIVMLQKINEDNPFIHFGKLKKGLYFLNFTSGKHSEGSVKVIKD